MGARLRKELREGGLLVNEQVEAFGGRSGSCASTCLLVSLVVLMGTAQCANGVSTQHTRGLSDGSGQVFGLPLSVRRVPHNFTGLEALSSANDARENSEVEGVTVGMGNSHSTRGRREGSHTWDAKRGYWSGRSSSKRRKEGLGRALLQDSSGNSSSSSSSGKGSFTGATQSSTGTSTSGSTSNTDSSISSSSSFISSGHEEVDLVLSTVRQQQQAHPEKRLVIAITPTYTRAFQALYFNHLVASVRGAGPPFLWLIIEGWKKSNETAQLLQRTAGLCLPAGMPGCQTVPYIHMAAGKNESSRWNKAVLQRNAGLSFIERMRIEGTVYFMDDDNTYNPLLFEELRKVRRIASFPVGFLFSVEYAIRSPWQQHRPTVERPLVRRRQLEEGESHPAGPWEVYGWETFEWSIPKKHGGAPRTFCTDMAGFAFNSELLWTKLENVPSFPKHPIRFQPVTGGYLETIFLGKIVPSPKELEAICDNARQVLVWHTHGEAEKYYRYPGSWKLPQPQPDELVLITGQGTTWNYAIGQYRYGIKGRKDTDVRPGYKETGVPGPPGRSP